MDSDREFGGNQSSEEEVDSLACLIQSRGNAPANSENEMPPIAGIVVKDKRGNSDFLYVQEANNIIKAAYKEVMTLAFKASTWVVGTPAVGSIEDFLDIFRSPPPPGMRLEQSIESAVIPIATESLVSVMMNVDRWASLLSQIVLCASITGPIGILQQQDSDANVKLMRMVTAELFVPTPFVSTRKFRFIRCLMEIIPNIWIVLDISDDYFNNIPSDSTFKPNCRRRPSGVVIRKCEEHSEVIWIENVEVNDGDNLDMAFCAKRWVNALSQKIKRQDSEMISINREIGWKVSNSLLKVTETMEKVFLECVNEIPNENKWALLSDRGVRILRSIIGNHNSAMGSNDYIALTNFRLPKKPSSVLDLLVRKNMEIQWPSLPNVEEPEEVIKLVAKDGRDYITVHKKAYEHMVQVISRDEFCSFIISSPMIQHDVDLTLIFGILRDNILKPSGFTVMPDGPPQSNVSLVTIAMQQELVVSGTEEAIEVMSKLVTSIVNEISEAAV